MGARLVMTGAYKGFGGWGQRKNKPNSKHVLSQFDHAYGKLRRMGQFHNAPKKSGKKKG